MTSPPSLREQDGQASGGNDFGSDDWIFTIREKDPKKLQNGEGQSGTEQVGRGPLSRRVPTRLRVRCQAGLFPSADERHSKEAFFPEPGHGHLPRAG